MSELRWHPLLEEWVVVASHRQDRPQMPADWCPFCPGSGQVPDDYDVLVYPNDFPAFDRDCDAFDLEPGLFKSTRACGVCDVVLYSPKHTLPPSQLTPEQWRKVVALWTQRAGEISKLSEVKYIMPFENTGEAIGVTMPHPHGQIYGFPFCPPLVKRELAASSAFYEREGKCLYCETMKREIAESARIVVSNSSFVAFIPFAARFPSEIQLYSRRHVGSFGDLRPEEADDLASMLSIIRKKYDNLYGFLLPLMMVIRIAPPQGEHPYFHFHLEFLPLQRSAKKLKYLAAVETGSGTFLADTKPEERADELRRTEPVTV
jgi:UDPglucose--hexose-1-phosphate uridylyltransferase